MGRDGREPIWLTRLIVDAVHVDQLREHGGLAGVRDENALESALARPQQKWHDDEGVDLPGLAAAYGFGLTKNHPYRDGNTRTACLAMLVFLGLNGLDFDAPETDVVATMTALAAGEISEKPLAAWLRRYVAPLK